MSSSMLTSSSYAAAAVAGHYHAAFQVFLACKKVLQVLVLLERVLIILASPESVTASCPQNTLGR